MEEQGLILGIRVFGLSLEYGLLVVPLTDIEHLTVEVDVGYVVKERRGVSRCMPTVYLQCLIVRIHRQLLVSQLSIATPQIVVESALNTLVRRTSVSAILADELLVCRDCLVELLQPEVAVA